MSLASAWWSTLATVGVLLAYEGLLIAAQRHRPELLARPTHALLREQWFEAVSAREGSELLAVQTLRNSLMSATMLASTAALSLMGTLTLAAPALHAGFAEANFSAALLTPRLVLELALIALLFGSLVSTVMSVRFYNHASYVAALPVGTPVRRQWNAAGIAYVRKAGLLYSYGLRHLVLVVPVVAAILLPPAGPVATVVVALVLFMFDRVSPRSVIARSGLA